MKVAANCNNCRHHANKPTTILMENRAALAVFQDCRQQWRAGLGGAYALDGNVVWRLIDEIAPADRLATWRRVETLAAHYLTCQQKRRNRTNARSKSRHSH